MWWLYCTSEFIVTFFFSVKPVQNILMIMFKLRHCHLHIFPCKLGFYI